MSPDTVPTCWVCGSADIKLVRRGVDPASLAPDDFAITDKRYGLVADLYKCRSCGFLECPKVGDIVSYYEGLEDSSYVATGAMRAVQQRRLLARLPRARGSLLDVGAGSGLLVAEAREVGFDAVGVEPSRWLQQRAVTDGVPVVHGTLPHPDLTGPYDVVTLVDVLEHVTDPVGLLRTVEQMMAPEGVGLVVTPDVGSMLAKVLGRRWWHYRIAHVGYFRRATLLRALEGAGLEPVTVWRPSWHFPFPYLWERLRVYLPFIPRRVPHPLSSVEIPLNLGDSLAVVFRRKAA